MSVPTRGWIGVDLDGTLAMYHGWKGVEHIGAPIPAMVRRVKQWLAEGRDVRIFTARVCRPEERERAVQAIETWCELHIGRKLPVTGEKDYAMAELWDDRCVPVVPNVGVIRQYGV